MSALATRKKLKIIDAMTDTIKKRLVTFVEMFDRTPAGSKYDKVRMDAIVRSGDTGDTKVGFSAAIKELSMWSLSDGHRHLPNLSGAFLKAGCDRALQDSWIMFADWASPIGGEVCASDADFPYVRTEGASGRVKLSVPTSVFQLAGIAADPSVAFAAARDASDIDFDRVLGLDQATRTVIEAAVAKFATSPKSGADARRIASDMMASMCPLSIALGNIDAWTAVSGCSPRTFRAAMSYLAAPFDSETMVRVHEAGVRVPFGIVRATSIECEVATATKATVSVDEGSAIVAHFAVPRRMGHATAWMNGDCHGRFLQAMSTRDIRAAFSTREKIPAVVDYHRTVDSSGRGETWNYNGDIGGIMDRRLESYAEWRERHPQ